MFVAMELRDKVAIVTGASRGVGAATAVALAAAGCKVACAARATDAAPLPISGTIDATVRTITDAGGDAIAVPTNLAHEEEVHAMVDTTIAAFGRVDILVNNAAITFPGDLDLPMKRFDLVMQVDLRAPLVAMVAVLPGMKARGERRDPQHLVGRGAQLLPGPDGYGMAKAAMEHMTVSAAHQLAPHAHRGEHVPHRRAGRVRRLPRELPGCRHLRLGTVGGRGRRHRVDARATAVVHGPQRRDGRAARRARHHAVTQRSARIRNRRTS